MQLLIIRVRYVDSGHRAPAAGRVPALSIIVTSLAVQICRQKNAVRSSRDLGGRGTSETFVFCWLSDEVYARNLCV